MKTIRYRGYDIQPDCPYFDDIRRWGVRCLIRRSGHDGPQPEPATSQEFFGTEQEAIAAGIECARAMIDGHLDRGTGALVNLERF
ncbi:hypothetical protein PCO31110_02002 [Pandoraea communis]|uniref:Uncharacterized protein n=1 Tax=Pandoraea communis TaxID=2508297 RepID=A0A5E4UFI8_9BURK|nr:DUF6566 family protein [Pandoraea communis]VVD98272.1 hypothetical protein PCO31110_02002 [Pandoraea communis]